MFRTTNVQNKWKIGPSEGILFHFPPETPFSAGNAPALTSPAKRSAAPSPDCTRSVRSPQRPIRLPRRPVRLPHRPVQLPHRPVQLPHRPARLLRRPAWLPHDPAPSSRRHDCHSSIPVPASPTPVLASLRQPLLPSGRATKETGTKKSAFFWSIRKIFTTFTTYCSDNLVSAPQRFARRIRLSSHPGIPMTGDVPAAGSEQHTETTYLSIFNQKTQKHEKIRHPSPDVVLCAHCRSAG